MTDKNGSFWSRLWARPKAKWCLGIPLGALLAFVVGAGSLGGFNAMMTFTNSNEFCYGCHIGMDTIVEEYQSSVHFNNTKGLTAATCGDCHVPHELLPKLWLKIGATKDIYLKLKGDITLDNFEAEHRPRLAAEATKTFKEENSKNCRHCHDVNKMDFENQSKVAARRHQGMEAKGQTCVDCHAGIAHKLPE